MNWTGGRLSRHSRDAKATLAQKQKQYFAKVRNNSLGRGQKGSPIKWSLFEKDQTIPQQNLPDPSDTASTSSNQVSNQPSYRVYGTIRKEFGEYRKSYAISPAAAAAATQQQNPSSQQMPLLQNEYHLNHRLSDSPHEERLMPPQGPKRKLRASSVQVEDTVLSHIPEKEEPLEERRRKILGKSDWVGANIQRPLKLKYKALTTDGKIGKRRRIDPNQKTFGAILQPIVSSSFEAPKLKARTREATLVYANSDDIQSGWIQEPRNHVRVFIGGKHKLVGATSGTCHPLTHRDHLMSSQASTPDAMLLDAEDTNRRYNTHAQDKEGKHSDPLLPLLLDSEAIRVSNPQMKIPQKRPALYGEWTPGHRKIVSAKFYSEDKARLLAARTSTRNTQRLSEPQVTKQEPCLSDSSYEASPGRIHLKDNRRLEISPLPHFTLAKLQSLRVQRFEDITNLQYPLERQTGHHRIRDMPSSPQGDCIVSESKRALNSVRKLQLVAWEKARNTSQLSSGPQLLHPIPQSSRKPPVLRTFSPEDADSAIAQLGTSKRVVPPSQLLDEEVWKTWILSSDTKNGEDEFKQHGMEEVLFSPGISAIAYPLDQGSSMQRTVVKENILAATNKEYSENRSAPEAELQESERIRGQTASANLPHDKWINQVPGEALITLPVVDYRKTFILRSKPAQSPSKAIPEPNPEEAWMKFILSDNIDHDEDISAIATSCPQKAFIELPKLLPPKSSLLAHPSTDVTSCTRPSSSNSNLHSSPSAPEATFGSTATTVHNTHVSNQTTRGSNISSSDPISRSLSHISKYRFPNSSEGVPPSNLPRTRKVLFNKPPRFNRCGYRTSFSPDELASGKDDVLHIGLNRKVLGRDARKYADKYRNRQRVKDIYSLSSSDDEVESIEGI